MRYLTIIAIFCALFFGFVIALSLNTDAKIVTVGPGQDYDYITNAISHANENDTIQVYNGTYNENIVIDKPITLTSVYGSGSTTIISRFSSKNTIDINADFVKISGFKIKNIGSTTFACIKLDTVSNCLIENNIVKYSTQGNGIHILRSDDNIIQDNTVEYNYIGIYLSISKNNIIRRNKIQNNDNYGLFLTSTSTGNTVYLNDFSRLFGYNAGSLGDNKWNYNSQGNYWDDYNGNDINGDGIGDTPYIIEGIGNKDNYPLGDFLSSGSIPFAYINSISPNPANYDETITFIGHGSDDGSIVAWEWRSDEEIIASTSTFSTSSLSFGTHTISFRVKDNDLQWSQYVYETLIINPNQKPIATIIEPETGEQFVYSDEVEFLGEGIDPDGEITGYMWRSEPVGISSEENSFINTELPIGTNTIYFKVKDDNDEWSEETSITIEILSEPKNQKPFADAGGPYNSVTNKDITFNGSKSFDPDEGDTISYNWEFGDGSTGEGAFTNHKYTSEGNYTIELTITDSYGEQTVSTTYAVISLLDNDYQKTNENMLIIGIVIIALILVIILLVWKKYK